MLLAPTGNDKPVGRADQPPPSGPGRMFVHGGPRCQWERGRRNGPSACGRPRRTAGYEHFWCWSAVAERGMWAEPIVMLPPSLDDDLRLLQRVEDLAVQDLVAQPGVEALDIAVLPRRARSDASRFRPYGGAETPLRTLLPSGKAARVTHAPPPGYPGHREQAPSSHPSDDLRDPTRQWGRAPADD